MGAYTKVREIAMECDQALFELRSRSNNIPPNQVLQENRDEIRLIINHTLDGIIGHSPLESSRSGESHDHVTMNLNY